MSNVLFETDPSQQKSGARLYALLFLALGAAIAAAELMSYGGFAVAGNVGLGGLCVVNLLFSLAIAYSSLEWSWGGQAKE